MTVFSFIIAANFFTEVSILQQAQVKQHKEFHKLFGSR